MDQRFGTDGFGGAGAGAGAGGAGRGAGCCIVPLVGRGGCIVPPVGRGGWFIDVDEDVGTDADGTDTVCFCIEM